MIALLLLALCQCPPPTITAQPIGLEACTGSPVVLRVGVSDGSVRWLHDGQPTDYGPELHIDSVSTTDAGMYQAVVTNGCGAVTSEKAEVVVYQRGIGDPNGDGRVDGADIGWFVAAMLAPEETMPGPQCAADVDGNGLLDGSDVRGFVDRLIGD